MFPTLPIVATLLSLVGALADRHRQLRAAPDRGLTTLEMVILGLGLFLAAAALIAVFNLAIQTRSDQIQ